MLKFVLVLSLINLFVNVVFISSLFLAVSKIKKSENNNFLKEFEDD